MRILVAALGSPGHSFPLVPLALALRDEGHDVTFATGDDTRAAVAGAGLEVVVAGSGLGPAFREAIVRRGLTERPTDREEIFSVAAEVFGEVLPRGVVADLLPWFDEHRPDLVISETADPGAALVAARHDVPVVVHSFGRRAPGALPMSGRVTAALAALGAGIGAGHLEVGAPLGPVYLDICPPSLQAAPDPSLGSAPLELALRPTPWNPVVAFTPQVTGGRWVYVTLGTAMGDAGVLRRAVEGLRRLDVDVLVATGSVEVGELADLDTDGVQVEPFVPQADLFAAAPPALVVHHGGSGTTLATAAAGIPQMFLPQGADQFLNAEAVQSVGAGRLLPASAVGDAEAFVEAAGAMAARGAPQRAPARALAAEIAAMPSPADVAADVARWV